MEPFYILLISSGLCDDFQRLKQSLGVLKCINGADQANLNKIIQDTIKDAISTAVLKSVDIQILRAQMYYLCHTSFDVPSLLADWAKKQVEIVYDETVKKFEDPKPDHPLAPIETSLFNKNTLYHASLCCQAVHIGKAQHKEFLNVQGHNLQEVSMTRSLVKNNVLIAKQDNIVYVAFQSEPSLSGWSKYETFSEGMKIELTSSGCG